MSTVHGAVPGVTKLLTSSLADVLGGNEVYGGSIGPALQVAGQVIASDPSLWISAAAAVTSNLTFGITQSVVSGRLFILAPGSFLRHTKSLSRSREGDLVPPCMLPLLTLQVRYTRS